MKGIALIPVGKETRKDTTWPPQDPLRRLVFAVYLEDECVCGKKFDWDSLLVARWFLHEKGRILHKECWKDSMFTIKPDKPEKGS